MAYSTQRVVSDGTLVRLEIEIDYLNRTDLQLFYDNQPADPATWSWIGTSEKAIAFDPAVPAGVEVLVARATDLAEILHVFSPQMGGGGNAAFTNLTMDENFRQLLLIAQEAAEGATLSDVFQDLDMHGYRILNLGPGDVGNPGAVPNMGQLFSLSTAAGTYATQAAASAAAAAASQSAAASSATAAESARDAAAGNATAAQGSATAAAGSATSAAGSASTATTQAGLALTRANLARDWASKMDGPVADGLMSSRYYAEQAAAGAGLPVYTQAAAAALTSDVGDIWVAGSGPQAFYAGRYVPVPVARNSYTRAQLAALTAAPGGVALGTQLFCSDALGGPSPAVYTGTEWLSLKTGIPVDVAPHVASGSHQVWRYSDGTMRQRFVFATQGVPITAVYGAGFLFNPGSSYSWYTPFVGGVPATLGGTIGSYSGGGVPVVVPAAGTTTGFSFFIYAPVSFTSSMSWYIEGVGRWKV